MGISEHLERHPDKEELNLSDLTLQEKREKQPEIINPREEIESNKKEIIEKLEFLESEGEWEEYLSLASNVKFIYPEIFDDFTISDAAFENIKGMMDRHLEDGRSGDKNWGWLQFSSNIMDFVNLFPDRIEDFTLDDRAKKSMENNLDFLEEQENYHAYIGIASSIKIAFPDYSYEDMGINDKWDSIKKELQAYISKKSWVSAIHMISFIKIVFPNKAEHLPLDDKLIEGAKEELNKYRQNNRWKKFTSLLLSIEIINAQEVKITDKGLKIVMPKKKEFKGKTPERPKRKQF